MYFSLCIEHTSVRILVYHIFVEFFERRDTTRRFNVRRLLAFDACLASIHLLQFPRRFHPPIHPKKHPRIQRKNKKKRTFIPNFEYIWSVIYALRFHFVGDSLCLASLMVPACDVFYLFVPLAVQTIYNFNAHTEPSRWLNTIEICLYNWKANVLRENIRRAAMAVCVWLVDMC